jgi:chromosome segregation ATPase
MTMELVRKEDPGPHPEDRSSLNAAKKIYREAIEAVERSNRENLAIRDRAASLRARIVDLEHRENLANQEREKLLSGFALGHIREAELRNQAASILDIKTELENLRDMLRAVEDLVQGAMSKIAAAENQAAAARQAVLQTAFELTKAEIREIVGDRLSKCQALRGLVGIGGDITIPAAATNIFGPTFLEIIPRVQKQVLKELGLA